MNKIIPEVKYVDEFSVTGISTRTQNSDEMNSATAKIPALWQEFRTSDLANSPMIYGVYSAYSSDVNGFYTLTVGTPHKAENSNSETIIIPSGNYLVFNNRGTMPAAVIHAWQEVWNYFAGETEYQRQYGCDFEVYYEEDQVSIYIGI